MNKYAGIKASHKSKLSKKTSIEEDTDSVSRKIAWIFLSFFFFFLFYRDFRMSLFKLRSLEFLIKIFHNFQALKTLDSTV